MDHQESRDSAEWQQTDMWINNNKNHHIHQLRRPMMGTHTGNKSKRASQRLIFQSLDHQTADQPHPLVDHDFPMTVA